MPQGNPRYKKNSRHAPHNWSKGGPIKSPIVGKEGCISKSGTTRYGGEAPAKEQEPRNMHNQPGNVVGCVRGKNQPEKKQVLHQQPTAKLSGAMRRTVLLRNAKKAPVGHPSNLRNPGPMQEGAYLLLTKYGQKGKKGK